jgi:hypothetical protein
MALLTHRTFKFPVALAVSAGLGLSSIAGLPAPASASAPVIAGVPEPPDRRKQLKKALITEKDVPAGYVKQDLPGFADIAAELLQQHTPGASPCEVPDDVASLATGGPMIDAAPPAPSAPEPVKTGSPAPEPVKGSPPPPPAGELELPPTAEVVFSNEETGALALEVLSAGGEDAALEMIDQVQEILEECPLIEIGTVKITTRPLNWNPPLGDESITATVAVEAKFMGIEVAIRFTLAQVAYRDVSLTVGLAGADDPQDREFKKITRAAVRKLVTTSGISTSGSVNSTR